jgi:hypothetical protein
MEKKNVLVDQLLKNIYSRQEQEAMPGICTQDNYPYMFW